MSLFPAYDKGESTFIEKSEIKILGPEYQDGSWLTNSSFQQEIFTHSQAPIEISSDSSDCELITFDDNKQYSANTSSSMVSSKSTKLSHSKKHKKWKKHSQSNYHKSKGSYASAIENVYFEDKLRDKGNFKVDTLTSRVRPLYDLGDKTLGFIVNPGGRKKLIKRYFAKDSQSKKNKNNENNILLQDPADSVMFENNEKTWKIKAFNQRLIEEPNNIDLWLEYANFDNSDKHLAKIHDCRDCDTPKYQRMLSIIEKGLEINQNSEKLLKMKLELMGKLLPADELSDELGNLIKKDPSNVLLWQALIAVMRSSVAMCTVPRILELYGKCFDSLHLWPRTCQELYDTHLLTMLYQCLIFLRHAGLWEQMWEVIRMNLNLNFGKTTDLQNLKGFIDEKKLIEMEEVILTSRLPLDQLWLRVQLLRENSHWVSINREQLEFIGDSHRFITPEDVTEYVHPLLTKHSNLKMAICTLHAIKVPLLPTRHAILQELGIDKSNWSVDSLESLLALFYPCVGEMAGHEQRTLLSTGLLEGGLTSGPQYLRYHPAQETYLEFLRQTFSTIASNLEGQHKTSIYVWWLRFERMLIAVQKDESVKTDKGLKKLKGILKEFLKKNENRNNLYYYREYALIEYELGRLENCINILETAIQSKGNFIQGTDETALVSLYRTLVEVLLDVRNWHENSKSHVLKVFCQMSNGQNNNECFASTEKYLQNFYNEFIQNSELSTGNLEDKFFLSDVTCDTIMCYVYFLYINNHNLAEILKVFDKCLEKSRTDLYLHECFHENKIKFLQLIHEKHRNLPGGTLGSCLNEALKKFPNNFYILSVFAGRESESPHWSVSTQNESNRLWPNIALCLARRARLYSSVCSNNPVSFSAALNKLLHLHKRLSKIPQISYCPLLWRLYMLLLREQNLCATKGDEVYHESVAQCPWARCMYMDAAQIAPQYVTQIQDVMREKNLRMHVTPEELDILRGS